MWGFNMRRLLLMHLLSLICFWAITCPTTSAQQPGASQIIVPIETWTNVFAAKQVGSTNDVDLHLRVKAPANAKSRIFWSLAIDNAVVQRQEIELAARAESARITLRIPHVREGLVAHGKLVVALSADGQAVPTATSTKKLHIYPYQPFYQRTQWLKDLRITLYDPRARTASCLRKLDVPFTEIREAAALADIKSGLVVIGEGVSFEDERDLPPTLQKLAAQGLPVLCLAPSHGAVPMPPAGNGPSAPASVMFAGAGIIHRLDKKLDAGGWAGDGPTISASLALKSEDGAVVADVADGTGGWPWLELRYPGTGRLVLCGFSFVKHWEAGPTPRFLLARILESLVEK